MSKGATKNDVLLDFNLFLADATSMSLNVKVTKTINFFIFRKVIIHQEPAMKLTNDMFRCFTAKIKSGTLKIL